MASRKRNSNGKFIESSPYGKKNLGIRLLKKDESTLIKMAKEKDITPTELARIAIAEWLKQQEETA